MSESIAESGARWKKSAPPPRKGSKYRLKRAGAKAAISVARQCLPPAHLRKGRANERVGIASLRVPKALSRRKVPHPGAEIKFRDVPISLTSRRDQVLGG